MFYVFKEKRKNFKFQNNRKSKSTGPPEQGGSREGVSSLPLPFRRELSVDVLFFLMNPLNVLFLQEVVKIVQENQQAKSRASYITH